MGSALRNTTFEQETSAPVDALRLQVAERLAAHRSRRGGVQAATRVGGVRLPEMQDERAARIVAAVAERYARSQSYRAYLAAEAERAVQQAQAAAEVAALNAQAMLAAQQTLLETLRQDDAARDAEIQNGLPQEMRLWPDAEAEIGATPKPRSKRWAQSAGARKAALAKARDEAMPKAAAAAIEGKTANETAREEASAEAAHGGLRVRLFDEAVAARLQRSGHGSGYGPVAGAQAGSAARYGEPQEDWCDAEAMALDEEIAFRQAPVFEEPAGPPMALPANLIEFPRQLVASRKARPRLAEGPLLAEAEAAVGAGQLRIFEVDPTQIDTTPATAPAAMPQWTSLWLDAPGHGPAEGYAVAAQALDQHATAIHGDRAAGLPEVASIGRRVAAAAIDGGVILAGFFAAAGAFLLSADRGALWQPGAPAGLSLRHIMHAIGGQVLLQPGMVLAGSALALGMLHLLYQALFFSLAGATPGMRSARIALCTFAEENPTRSAMLGRIVAAVLSACPLGLGFVWAALDEDRLTWHDRVSRMYQRCY